MLMSPGDDHIKVVVQETLCNEVCAKRENDLKQWISKIDSRLWAIVAGLVFNLIGVVAVLLKMKG
jgi:hypothetical protein